MPIIVDQGRFPDLLASVGRRWSMLTLQRLTSVARNKLLSPEVCLEQPSYLSILAGIYIARPPVVAVTGKAPVAPQVASSRRGRTLY